MQIASTSGLVGFFLSIAMIEEWYLKAAYDYNGLDVLFIGLAILGGWTFPRQEEEASEQAE